MITCHAMTLRNTSRDCFVAMLVVATLLVCPRASAQAHPGRDATTTGVRPTEIIVGTIIVQNGEVYALATLTNVMVIVDPAGGTLIHESGMYWTQRENWTALEGTITIVPMGTEGTEFNLAGAYHYGPSPSAAATVGETYKVALNYTMNGATAHGLATGTVNQGMPGQPLAFGLVLVQQHNTN